MLQSEADRFRLVFSFADPNGQATPEIETSDELPEYILVLPEAGPAQPAAAIALAAPAAGAPSGATP